MRDRIVARIRSNRISSLIVRLTSHRRGRLVDLRVYDDPSFNRGFGATSVGIAIRPAMLRSVIEALEKAEDAARAEGLIERSDEGHRSGPEPLPRAIASTGEAIQLEVSMSTTPISNDDRTSATGKSEADKARPVQFEDRKDVGPGESDGNKPDAGEMGEAKRNGDKADKSAPGTIPPDELTTENDDGTS